MIGIRTDANGIIAMGHLMRCMSIARQLAKRQQEVIFIISENDSEQLITENGFQCICLNNHYNEKEAETDTVIRLIQEYRIEKMIVDSYEVTKQYLEKLREAVYLIYIDDINAFKYPVDMLINYSFNTTDEVYRSRSYDTDRTRMLLGAEYVPLREEFGGEAIAIKKRAESLFITTGGADEFDMITDIVCGLNQSDCRDMKKYIVAGKFYKYKDKLEELRRQDSYIEFYMDIPDIDKVMRKGDIAISAGGTTLAELCSCGIPTICFTMADNQLASVTEYAKAGLMYCVGDIRGEGAKNAAVRKIVYYVNELREQYDIRAEMGTKAKSAIDGNGAERIAQQVMKVISPL